MREANQSRVFWLFHLGLSWQPQQQQFTFIFFLSMCLITVLNLLVLWAISKETHLHTPIYFLLSNMAFADICFSSTIPKTQPHTGSQTISFSGCLTQFIFMFMDMDHFLLAMMACDFFVIIFHPLYYEKVIYHLCAMLVTGSWVIANLHVLLHTLQMAQVSFYADNTIRFFCDRTILLELLCSDTHLGDMIILIKGGMIMIIPFICILVLYILVTCAALRVPSIKGRWKAFYNCGSHMAVVFFFGTIFLYFNALSPHSAETDITVVVMFTVVTMLNLFIYSLRNKDIKGALGKMIAMKFFLFKMKQAKPDQAVVGAISESPLT
ncbi:LOW QUALITY PROTEIN: olfactory receptor 1F1 [Rhynchonycteris naso]